MNDIKVIFMGTPQFAVPVLEELIKKYNVLMVVSQPDRERDRKGNIIFSPIKELAIKNNIPVFQPEKIRKSYQEILDLNPDIIITCAYGQIIPEVILDYPKYGCINVHGSLLPKLRGGAPIQHAIIDGYTETGITIMYMDKGMDTGDIISMEKIPITDEDNYDSLHDKLSILGASLLMKTLPAIINDTNNRIKQDSNEATYGYNISKEDEKIDFALPSIDVFNKIRGLSSVPGAYCMYNNLRLKIYDCYITDEISSTEYGKIVRIDKTGMYINTFDKVIRITDIKLEGKKRCKISDFINGIKKEEYEGVILK